MKQHALFCTFLVAFTIAPLACREEEPESVTPPAFPLTLEEVPGNAGSPTWELADFNLLKVTGGTAASGYAEMGQSVQCLLSTGHELPSGGNFIPTWPHDFDGNGEPDSLGKGEITRGAADCGFERIIGDEPVVPLSLLQPPSALNTAFMLIPREGLSAQGRSFYAASAPIIPDSLQPIVTTGAWRMVFPAGSTCPLGDAQREDGTCVLDPNFAMQTTPFSALTDAQGSPLTCDGQACDGYSHIPMLFVGNTDFFPAGIELRGRHLLELELRDPTGAGWSLEARFVIE